MSGFESNQNHIDLVRFPVAVKMEICLPLLELDMYPRGWWDRQTHGHVKDSSRISTKFDYERTGVTDTVSVKYQFQNQLVLRPPCGVLTTKLPYGMNVE
jgi:hypothetical protein